MLLVKDWVKAHLEGDATLAALVPAASIVLGWPHLDNTAPILAYREDNQPAVIDAYSDDQPYAFESSIFVDIFVRKESNNLDQIIIAIDNIFLGLLFSIEFSSDIPEPESNLLHRAMRYRRKVMFSDLLI